MHFDVITFFKCVFVIVVASILRGVCVSVANGCTYRKYQLGSHPLYYISYHSSGVFAQAEVLHNPSCHNQLLKEDHISNVLVLFTSFHVKNILD